MEICIVSGARPNFIKVAPLIRQIDNLRREAPSAIRSSIRAGKETPRWKERSSMTSASTCPMSIWVWTARISTSLRVR